jgi:hypothetical protein
VHTLRFSAIAYHGDFKNTVDLVAPEDLESLFKPEKYPALPAKVSVTMQGQPVLRVVDDEGLLGKLPSNKPCQVEVTHRWLTFGGVREPFGYMEIHHGGFRYACERSAASFFGAVSLVITAPLLLWALLAFPLLIHPRHLSIKPLR